MSEASPNWWRGHPRTEEELIQTLMDKSYRDPITNCLVYTGTKSHGYGKVYWRGKGWALHRLAYKLENPDEELNHVRHICDNPACWALIHLINGTQLENDMDKINKKRHNFGIKVPQAKLNDEIVLEIRASSLNLQEAAKKYGVTPSNIFYIRKRKSWKHLP